MRHRDVLVDALIAGAWAAALSGIPSTLHELLSGGDPMQATRAAGAMLIPPDASDVALLAAAIVVHAAVTLFWALVLAFALPRRHVVAWSVGALALVAVLDLRVIARYFFPEVYALPFTPQLADHLAWGATFGAALAWRRGARLVDAKRTRGPAEPRDP
ncbi:MAG TPA: hypothetical protein VFP44_12260 [Usitatibacter sp.]|nr:hypothetical protein [Usitatibacter sp.]